MSSKPPSVRRSRASADGPGVPPDAGAIPDRTRTSDDDLLATDATDTTDESGDPDEDDVEEELATLDPSRPTAHQRAGGAPRELGWVLAVGGLLGLWASMMLVLSQLRLLRDPDAALGCDLNPLIGCGSFLQSWQSSVLGPPNALIGTVAFAATMTVGVVLLSGVRPARWFWRALLAGSTGAILSVLWFQYQAFTTIRGLCPYCLVVWAVTIPVFVHVLARAAQGGHVPASERLRRALVQDRWVVVAVWYALVVLLAVVVFWEQWLAILF
ncbi:vitamin K epoxide reductase family protein [Georgenia sp. 10Sc9-8]|uniref:Vitamin K epoxide reductase family protein n=1 Tax=Georgenia halotolerans TaxID=3028317 RepID=A0ABT5TTX2_9MICO|nr:vitamin K epoxide reductase family protein [Georgenia halotolerans]